MLVTQSKRLVLQLLQKTSVVAVSLGSLFGSTLAKAEYALNFQTPVTEVARDIYGLHMLIFWICVAIFVAVFGVMFYSIFVHRKSKNFKPSTFSHSTKVEIVWTVIPFLILVAMAVPATTVLIKMEDTTKSDLTIKITGYQWKWGYEYLDSGIEFFSTLTTPREQIDQFDKETAQPLGENYLLETDNHVIVPSGRKIRALITANDVIHAWWIPAFGTKKDAIPGYINELWFNIDEGKEGIYRGQCAELCGKDHAFMPIVVEVVTAEKFDNWVASGGTSYDAQVIADAAQPSVESTAIDGEGTAAVVETVVPAAQAAVEKEWTKDELMVKGEEVYKNCIACHGSDGKGISGVFPAIAGSVVATGDIGAQIDLVMFGKSGTAMVSFANQLSDEEIAAVITYQRNSFGNNVGDFVSPAAVTAKR